MIELAELILSRFKGRDDHIAVGDSEGKFHPEKLKSPVTPNWFARKHLSGEMCLGFYLMSEDAKVSVSCLDFDNKPDSPDSQWRDKTESVYLLLTNVGMSPLVEVSQSGNAAHVWLRFEEPVDSWLVRAFWRGILGRLNLPENTEIYPRADEHTGKGLGNLVRYPMFGRSHFPDVEGEWDAVDPTQSLNDFSSCDIGTLKSVAFHLGFGDLRPQKAIEKSGDASGLPVRVKALLNRTDSLLAKRWSGETAGLHEPSQSRSALTQSICCELVRNYVPTPEIEQALRVWCRDNGYDKGQRDDWISRTVAKSYDFVLNRDERSSTEFTTLDAAAKKYVTSILAGDEVFIQSGIPELDDSIQGVGLGEICVIGARPSHGKSALARSWCENAALSGHTCLFVSEEMSQRMLGRRALQSVSSLPQWKWSDERNVDQINYDIDKYYSPRQPIYVVGGCGTVERVVEVIEQYVAVYGVTFVVVDYLQLLGSRHASRYESVTEISKQLTGVTKRRSLAMLALSQLSRDIEKDNNTGKKRPPRPSDLRESGQIEQDADLILLLHWPYKAGETEDKSPYAIYVPKRRNGDIKSNEVWTTFNPQKQTFGKGGPVET